MKSHITVLIEDKIISIGKCLENALEWHHLDEDSIQSIRNHHWDYWIFPQENGFDDKELRENYLQESEELLNNAAYVRNLPQGYTTSGVICCDGSWIDLQDFGWRMVDEPLTRNRKATEEWLMKLREILAANKEKICVQIITHC